MDSETLAAAKKDLRDRMQTLRDAAHKADADAARKLHDTVLNNVAIPAGAVVSGYWDIGSEMPSRKLMDYYRAQGHRIALPVVIGKDEALIFRAYDTDHGLVPGWHGIMEPPVTAAVVEPDFLFVPLLAFDRMLYRLGYGGGFYDRTLSELRTRKNISAIGLGYACQHVATLPVGLYDARLDGVATEASFWR